MGIFIIILGVLQVVGGLMAYVEAISAIHQILGAISFGMGILSVALGIAINELSAIRHAVQAQRTITAETTGYQEPMPDMSRWAQRDRDRYIAEHGR